MGIPSGECAGGMHAWWHQSQGVQFISRCKGAPKPHPCLSIPHTFSPGKAAVYGACAAMDPSLVLPVLVDAGCNNVELRSDPMYLGQR